MKRKKENKKIEGENILFKNALFDLDGTIIDSIQDILSCTQKAYEKEGIIGINPEQKQTTLPLLEYLRSLTPGLDTEIIEKVADNFRKVYDSSDYPKTKLYPLIKELLAELVEKGISIYLVTNKRLPPTLKILNKFGLKFKAVVAPDLFEDRKMNKIEMIAYLIKNEKIRAQDAIYIGDAVSDVKSAGANGIVSLAVTYGSTGEAELLKSGAKYIARNVGEIKNIILS